MRRVATLAALILCLQTWNPSFIVQAADVSFTALSETLHVWEDLPYPESILQCEDARGWMFLGAVHGHHGGVKLVDAPGRDGHALELWMDLHKESEKAPRWVYWRTPLAPCLSIQGVETIEVDVMPLDPIDFRVTARFGSRHGLGILPATWSSLGENLTVGQWHTVSVPVHSVRPNIDNLRFDVKVSQPGTPHRKKVRFLVDNVRFLPSLADPVAAFFTEPLTVHKPARTGTLTFSSRKDVSSGDTLAFDVELSLAESLKGALIISVAPKNGKAAMQWHHDATFEAPYSGLAVKIAELQADIGSGEAALSVRVVDEAGVTVAQSSDTPIRVYDAEDLAAKRRTLIERMNALDGRRQELIAGGIVANLPGVSLATSEMFLQDGGFIEDDFHRQHAYAHACEGLGQVESLLAKAEEEINLLAAGKTRELAVPVYDPSRPVVRSNGRILQGEKPLLFVGGIGWSQRLLPISSHLTQQLGFNAASVQALLKRYFDEDEATRELRQTIPRYLEETKQAGLAANLLLAGHYVPRDLSPEYADAIDQATGSSMLPWNILHPATRKIYLDWYDQILPLLAGQTHVVNTETANEPTHVVRASATNYEAAFRDWLRERHGSIEAVNEAWQTDYAAWDDLELPVLFDLMEAGRSPGLSYDWNCFKTGVEADFFGILKNRIHSQLPDLGVTIKILGHVEGMGYEKLNEQAVQARGETAIGTDGRSPLWLDYLKSMNPDQAVMNAEWHILSGGDVLLNPARIERRMFEGMAHGIAFGAIWRWKRTDWDAMSNGGEQCVTRYPITLDAIGRTAWKLRAMAEPITAFANMDGGRDRVLYDLNSQLHQGMEYAEGLEHVYQIMSRNSSGVRFLVAGQITRGALEGVDFIAAGAADALDENETALMAEWVKNGGMLWLTAPGLTHNPYGQEYPVDLLDPAFAQAVASPGAKTVGKGQVIVSETPPDLTAFLLGPWAADTNGNPVDDVEVRLVTVNKTHWLYLNNQSGEPRELRLTNWPAAIASRILRDGWDARSIDLTGRIELAPDQLVFGKLD